MTLLFFFFFSIFFLDVLVSSVRQEISKIACSQNNAMRPMAPSCIILYCVILSYYSTTCYTAVHVWKICCQARLSFVNFVVFTSDEGWCIRCHSLVWEGCIDDHDVFVLRCTVFVDWKWCCWLALLPVFFVVTAKQVRGGEQRPHECYSWQTWA